MKNTTAAVAAMMLGGAISAMAVGNTLQLDIAGGAYDVNNETTFGQADTFDLYALMTPDRDSTLSSTYRVSAAVYQLDNLGNESGIANVPADLGSITFAGYTLAVTSDMYYGVPPVDLLPGTVGVDQTLPTHNIFETYFREFQFQFDAANKVSLYNVQDLPDVDPVIVPSSTTSSFLYYQKFAVDVSDLMDGYGIHFDLYQVIADEKNGNAPAADATAGKKVKLVSGTFTPPPPEDLYTTIIEKAPFSHDAASSTDRDDPGTPVPDNASTLGLMGLGLIAIGGLRRAFARG